MRNEIEIEGKSVDDAVEKGLIELGTAKDDVVIKVLSEGSSGFLGMGGKPARVLITAAKAASKKAPPHETKLPKSVLSEADIAYAKQKTQTVIKELFSRLNITLSNIALTERDGFLDIEIETSDGSLVIGKGGQTLDSLEYILQLILNNDPKSRSKINLDTEHYRKKQRERLEVLAQKALAYVSRTGKVYRFEPMGARERKIIHSYLKTFPEVETFSDGEGKARKVAIKRSQK